MKYYTIIGDSSSGTHDIDYPEVKRLVNELSVIVATAYAEGYADRYDIQLKNAKLMSLSYHCLGGNKVMFKGGHKVYFPLWVKEEFVFNYIKWYMYFIRKFDLNKIPWKKPDPDKMAWGYYCQWIRSNAIRDTIAYLKRCDKEKELMNTLMDIAHHYCKPVRVGGVTISEYDDIDGYSPLDSEEYTPDMVEENEEISEE